MYICTNHHSLKKTTLLTTKLMQESTFNQLNHFYTHFWRNKYVLPQFQGCSIVTNNLYSIRRNQQSIILTTFTLLDVSTTAWEINCRSCSNVLTSFTHTYCSHWVQSKQNIHLRHWVWMFWKLSRRKKDF